MSKAEGEYELVLGNRQLLSAFFIIVILFGVFFTMGYIVGRNSAPSASAASIAAVATNQRPDAASSASPPSLPPPRPSPPETKDPAPLETNAVTPERNVPRKETASRSTPAPAPENPRRVEAPPSSSGVPSVAPGPGHMYLQVAAAAQPQAGVVVDTLKQKGFPALLTQGPNATLFRVVVGPFADAATLGKAKADLESAGFHPIVRK